MSNKILPIVLHKIVPDLPEAWGDISLDTFDFLLNQVSETLCSYSQDSCAFNGRFLLTFDDANYSDYEFVYSKLLAHKKTAIFFVPTNYIGRKGYLSWSNIIEMSSSGMLFGSHGHNHLNLTRIPFSEAHSELAKSKDILDQRLGVSTNFFSFPFGAHNKKTCSLAYKLGYVHLFTSNHGLASPNSSCFPRNSINSTSTFNQISAIISCSNKMQIKWIFEDLLKSSSRRLIGDQRYKAFRRLIFNSFFSKFR